MSYSGLDTIQFYDYHPKPADFHADVLHGLQQQQKVLSPKYFYDQRGSQLFDAICKLPEYYQTRTETGILQKNSEDISRCIGSGPLLIEPGSGSSHKVRVLLEEIKPEVYLPMDISKNHLLQAAQNISEDFPWLDVCASCIDFTDRMHIPDDLSEIDNKVVFFPGSSIGNFEPMDAIDFLKNIAQLVGTGGGLLIGVDLKKDPEIIHAAYNDQQGVTADFNTNLLTRINRELNANFVPSNFTHEAIYNDQLGRIEMHLVSDKEQQVNINSEVISFSSGESIHTENSYKYTIDEFQELAVQAGFRLEQYWVDAKQLFSVQYYTRD